MQAAWLAFAPLAPHMESLTYPFTVAVLSAAEAMATMKDKTETAAKVISTFFIPTFFIAHLF
jgi:hypothetical protein